MENKGTLIKFVVIIISILVIISIIVLLLILASQKSKHEEQSEAVLKKMNLYAEAKDSKTQESIPMDYVILSNGTFIKSGNTEDYLTEITIATNKSDIEFLCWSDGYYSQKINKVFSKLEKNLNSSKIDCNLNKSGDLEISHRGELYHDESKIILTLNSEEFKRPSFVMRWSSGIISAEYSEEPLSCNQGWRNSTTASDLFFCNEEPYNCTAMTDNMGCVTKEEEVPLRFPSIKKAYSLGKDINGEFTFDIKVNVAEDRIPGTDYLELIFYDKDIRYYNGELQKVSQFGEENVGTPEDKIYRIIVS